MTTDAMSCERFNEALMDYLEHDGDADTRASVEEHAGTCGDCGALLADIRKLRQDAASLPELAPANDLWSGIAARIETPVVPIGAGIASAAAASSSRGGTRLALRRWLNTGAIAASLVGAAAIGYSARDVEQRVGDSPIVTSDASPAAVPGSTDTTRIAQVQTPSVAPVSGEPAPRDRDVVSSAPAASPSAGTAARAPDVQLAVARLTADYDREIGRLRALIDQRRAQLDPVTVAVIERNLAVIDTAIAESRRAIASDPSSRFLIEFLNQSLQDKVELMRTAALLPSRT